MPPDHHVRVMLLHLLLCLVTAAIVSITAYLCAWFEYGNYIYFRFEQHMTRDSLEQLRHHIADYQRETGRLPESLTALDIVKKKGMPADEAGCPTDSWGRPFCYQVEGDTYDLYSLGRDGLPGGVGLDADLHAGQVNPESERLTLRQFTALPETNGIKGTCLVAGLAAFPLCLLGVKRQVTNRRSLVNLILVHGLTAAFAVLTALVMSFVHLPSGH